MLDVLYIGGAVLFFAATLLYARGCEALGRRPAVDAVEDRAP